MYLFCYIRILLLSEINNFDIHVIMFSRMVMKHGSINFFNVALQLIEVALGVQCNNIEYAPLN